MGAVTTTPTTLCGRPVAHDRALVMAIVNRTPDSFYDRGASFADDAARRRVEQVVAEGADIIDIGGVKAGPGELVDAGAEADRVVPFTAWVRAEFPDIVISIDTWRAAVADEACEAGADLINDTWAGADPELMAVAARRGAGLVCSHTGGAAPRTRPHRVRYGDDPDAVVDAVVEELSSAAARAAVHGVRADGIIIDPTHDFGKNTHHGLALLRHLDRLVATGHPVLMALSNKDFIGETLGVDLGDRLDGTLAATALAAEHGAAIFRAHEVAATRRVVEMVAAITGRRAPVRTIRGLA
ncbi:dihydropteroate synthase [Gordonia defluvii]|uniref:Dihydropteroate synthase n=2 Tax=Gordoniaceae TaxID=85026 RepID=A0ABP6LIT6_9ACTN